MNEDLHLTHPFIKFSNIFHIQDKKLKNCLHQSQTNTKVQQDENKMEEEKEDIGFGLGFILIL
jgi:hypothetical protein